MVIMTHDEGSAVLLAARSAGPVPAAPVPAAGSGTLGRVWSGFLAGIGALLGLVPHLLHHIGFLVGAAAVTGVVGSVVLGALGLVLSVPFLLGLSRRFHTWHAPAIALVLLAGMFALSAFVIGPAITGTGEAAAPAPTEQHTEHHPD